MSPAARKVLLTILGAVALVAALIPLVGAVSIIAGLVGTKVLII